jgi:hypothetical protein
MILRRTPWGHARSSLRRSDGEREHSRQGNNADAGGTDGAVNLRACPPGFPKGRPSHVLDRKQRHQGVERFTH